MTSSIDILRRYQAIADLSGRMLAEAQANRWDAVFILGQQYHDAVEALRGQNLTTLEDREARKGLLTQILNDDADIRRLAMPELDRLSSLLGNMKRQDRVLRTYSGTMA